MDAKSGDYEAGYRQALYDMLARTGSDGKTIDRRLTFDDIRDTLESTRDRWANAIGKPCPMCARYSASTALLAFAVACFNSGAVLGIRGPFWAQFLSGAAVGVTLVWLVKGGKKP